MTPRWDPHPDPPPLLQAHNVPLPKSIKAASPYVVVRSGSRREESKAVAQKRLGGKAKVGAGLEPSLNLPCSWKLL